MRVSRRSLYLVTTKKLENIKLCWDLKVNGHQFIENWILLKVYIHPNPIIDVLLDMHLSLTCEIYQKKFSFFLETKKISIVTQ